jgi:hypothetical protein
MHRTLATIAITVLVVLLIVGILDYINNPAVNVIPDGILKMVQAVLIGISIVLIASGLRSSDGDGNGGGGGAHGGFGHDHGGDGGD